MGNKIVLKKVNNVSEGNPKLPAEPAEVKELQFPSQDEQEMTGFMPIIVDDILRNVSAGMTLEDCASLLKMPPRILTKWYSENYCNFRYAVNHAKAKNKKLHVLGVQKGNKHSGWYLERKYKDEYSKEVTINVNHRIIDNVAQKTAGVLVKYIKDPDQLRLAAEELKEQLNNIDVSALPPRR